MLNFAYKNMDDLCIENKRRWKEELAAGLGQLMFIMVEARTTEELYLLCWVLCELWAGIGFNTFFREFVGEAATKRWSGRRSKAKELCELQHREGAQEAAGVWCFCSCKDRSHNQVTVVC